MNKGKTMTDDGKVWNKIDDLTDQMNKIQAELTKLRRMIEEMGARISSLDTRTVGLIRLGGGFFDD